MTNFFKEDFKDAIWLAHRFALPEGLSHPPSITPLFREQWKGAKGGKGGKVMEKVKACTSITLFCEGIVYYDMLVIDK